MRYILLVAFVLGLMMAGTGCEKTIKDVENTSNRPALADAGK